MSLTSVQKKVLLAGVVVAVLMAAFPPWVHTFPNREEPGGYAFIGTPPTGQYGGFRIDRTGLAIQWVATAACVGVGLLFAAKVAPGDDTTRHQQRHAVEAEMTRLKKQLKTASPEEQLAIRRQQVLLAQQLLQK
jgi:hypothetical protein